MKGLFLLGVVLSLLVFAPRLIKMIPPGTFSSPSGDSSGVAGAADGKTAPASPAGNEAVPDAGRQDHPSSSGGRPAKGAGASSSGPAAPAATPRAAAPSGSSEGGRSRSKSDEAMFRKLQAGMKKLWLRLKEERAAREAADRRLEKALRSLQVAQQVADLAGKAERKKFHVPEWNAPYCHKAKLGAGDQSKYVKIGVGLVKPRSNADPPMLSALLAQALLSALHKKKMPMVRLYRESSDHTKLLSDLLPPDQRDPDAPDDLEVGSLHLDATLQCTYAVGPTGELELHLRLFSIPRGRLLYEKVEKGRDYEGVVQAAARTVAGLPRDKLKAGAAR